jgi:large subunit ribosomal protein L4
MLRLITPWRLRTGLVSATRMGCYPPSLGPQHQRNQNPHHVLPCHTRLSYDFSLASIRSYHVTVPINNIPATARPRRTFDQEELPPNLRFDKKSSFAPKSKPMLMVPPTTSFSPKSAKTETRVDDNTMDENIKETAPGSTVVTNIKTDERISDDDEDDGYVDVDDDEIDEWDGDIIPPLTGSIRPVIPLPDRLHQTIYHGTDGSKAGTIWLNETVFGVDPIRIDLIKQNVDYIRNKIRGRRKAKTKTISEVSGSGRKVRPQKGTGRARAGHSRPAHWRGGAKAHGPKNTVDYGNVKMNKKSKILAIRSTLSQKVKEGNFILVDHLTLPSHKTKTWAKTLLDAYGIGKNEGGTSALILDHFLEKDLPDTTDLVSYRGVPLNLWVASSNLFEVKVVNQRCVNVYDMLRREKLIVTLSALQEIEDRWKDE